MLTHLQQAYADKPVRFLLFPCNQFSHQEPGSNAEVKAFAQKYVSLGPGSNVIMFSKSNLNNVSCTADGADVCTPASVECCPTNDGIYDYLLSVTSPGEIVWNFDKIVVDGFGRPFPGEAIFHGGDLGTVLSDAISQSAEFLVESQVAGESRLTIQAMALLLAIASFVVGLSMTQVKRQQRAQQTTSELSNQYMILA